MPIKGSIVGYLHHFEWNYAKQDQGLNMELYMKILYHYVLVPTERVDTPIDTDQVFEYSCNSENWKTYSK